MGRRIVRACRGVATVPAFAQYSNSEVLAWIRGGDVWSVVQFSPDTGDVSRVFPAQSLAIELEEVDRGRVPWSEGCFVQFLRVSKQVVKHVVSVAQGVPLFGGAGAERRRAVEAEGLDDDANARIVHSSSLDDIQLWPPPNSTRTIWPL